MHSLAADGFRRSLLGMLLVTVLLSAWATWFFLARVTLYEVSTTARLEVSEAAHPVEAQVAGRVRATSLILGQEVQSGDVLVELEADAQRLAYEEAQARQAALAAQLTAAGQQVAAEKAARRAEEQAARGALEEAHARHHEGEVAAHTADKEAALFVSLQARQLPAQLEVLRAMGEARRSRAAAETLRLAISRLEGEQQTRARERQVRLEQLGRERTRLEGELATTEATLARLAHDIEQRHIRAPISGRLGEVATLEIGAMVGPGDKLGAIVPPGTLKVMTDFPPPAALGRIQPGQPAQLRLEGFPWTQYGAISATVASVASEVRDQQVRVELAIRPDAAPPISLQHGLPGTVEVEVDHVSPVTLVLRTAGLLLTVPGTSRNFQGDRGADR
jgi:membrane fusion protein (multidrug efflux system)